MTSEQPLTYEEALIVLVLRLGDPWKTDTRDRARKIIEDAPVDIRAALARGPGGAKDAEPRPIPYGEWDCWYEAMKARALAAEAKLTDAALVEAGWVLRGAVHEWVGRNSFTLTLGDVEESWLSRRAAQSAAKSNNAEQGV